MEFVRLKKDRQTEVKKRELPQKPPPPKEPPPPPKLQVAKSQDRMVPQLNIPTPKIGSLKLSGGPFMGAVGEMSSDGEVIPLVKIQPRYPRKAARAGIEGWVKIEFTILEDGTVKDPKVIDSMPKKTFDRDALNAILRWKFKPKVVDGKPMQQRATQVIDFSLSKG